MTSRAEIGSGVIRIETDDSQVKKVGSESGGLFGKAFSAAAIGVAAAGAVIVGFGAKGLKEFATLEKGMNEVFTLMPGLTQDAMDSMTGDVRSFAKEMGVTTTEVVPALYQAISAGVPTDNVFDFLEVAQKAAIGGITELETAVDGISSVVNAYGSDVLSAADASDLMFTAVRLGKTDFGQLSSSIFNVTPIASALGVEFGDVAASLATLTGMGVPTSVATTQMRAAMSELAKEGTKADKAFRDAAGVGFQDFIEQGGNLEEALHLMADSAAASGVSVLDMFGSIEAGQAVLGLTGAGADAFAEAMAEMGDASGATDAAFAQMDQGLSRTWDRIKITFADAFLAIGQALAPFAQTFADKLLPAIDTAVTAFGDLMGVFSEGEGIVDGLRQVFSSLAGDTSLFDFLVSAAKTGFDNLLYWLTTGGVATLVNWFVTSRVRLLEAAIELFRSLLDAVVTIVPALVQSLADALTQVVAFIAEAFPLLLQTAVELFLALVDALVEILPQLIDTLVDVIVDVLDVVLDMVPQLLDAGIDLFLALVDALVEVLPRLLDTILTKVVPKVIEVVLKSVPKLLSAAITLFFALVDGVLKILPQLIDTLINDVIPEVVKTLIDMAPELLVAAIDLFFQLVKSLGDVGPQLLTALIELGKALVKQVVETGPALFKAGVSMISDLGKGVLEQGKKLIKDVKDKIVGAITKLWPFSPAKDGPLRRFPPEEAGANIMRLFAEGIAKGGKDAVRAAALSLDGLMPTGRDLDIGGMRLAPAAGGSVVFDVSVVVNGSMTREAATEAGRTMAEEAQKQLDRLSRARITQ